MTTHVNKEDLILKHPGDIAEIIGELDNKEQTLVFLLLPSNLKTIVFSHLDVATQETVLKNMGSKELGEILNEMAPDDRTALFEDFPDLLIKDVTSLLGDEERKVALNLIGYPENSVGRIMTPFYIQVHKDWTVGRTLQQIRKNGKKAETLNFVYVVDEDQKLIDDIHISKILLADDKATIESLMDDAYLSLLGTMNREDAISSFTKYDRSALPVVSESGVLVGIVTVDDMIDVIQQRDTEDIQKFGGLEALDLPYVDTPLFEMIRKRAGWLVILFVGEMFTAWAMGFFENELAQTVLLTLFLPLIISSGGNSGSQAATLIIRAMAIKELNIRDWFYVMKKEIMSGLALGLILGSIGFLRIMVWQFIGFKDYGIYWAYLGLTVSLSLIGVVLWGTLSGSMIPFILKRLRLDPATSSAPFVATLVDVTGLIIYFVIASVILKGKLLGVVPHVVVPNILPTH